MTTTTTAIGPSGVVCSRAAVIKALNVIGSGGAGFGIMQSPLSVNAAGQRGGGPALCK